MLTLQFIMVTAIAVTGIAFSAKMYYELLTTEPIEWEIDEDGTSI